MFFAPLLFVWILVLFFGLAFLFGLIQIGVITCAFQQIGLPPQMAFTALLASLIGSFFNIPITRIESGELVAPGGDIRQMGMRYYRVPMTRTNSTVLAVNVGGAIVPSLISLYLLHNDPGAILPALIATAIVAVVVNRCARPVPGMGIATPIFIPPIVAALAAYTFAEPHHAGAVAFAGGVFGTLIGADLLNLHKISGLGAPVASIGGAGTFDGIFLTGIVAALLV